MVFLICVNPRASAASKFLVPRIAPPVNYHYFRIAPVRATSKRRLVRLTLMIKEGAVQSHCLSFTRVPHSTRLFLDYLYQFDNVRRFFLRAPFSRDWLQDEVSRLHYDAARRERVAAILERQNRAWGASQETRDNIASRPLDWPTMVAPCSLRILISVAVSNGPSGLFT
jgi:hypothetical protein